MTDDTPNMPELEKYPENSGPGSGDSLFPGIPLRKLFFFLF
jgi:hypothetical protein